ncbi:uncharacterized protein LOC124438077 [Xenia sp. Carnegie-2017]|uniref:uncharacterized protein LOC124438077 n=1 Tax=Xenia sp. Carnegie-2017 TaxID=2897299 RepID=UPI001F038F24|nr:uncharacterized protein LOC124438077 [Xenia sp. Carnegie-2017]
MNVKSIRDEGDIDKLRLYDTCETNYRGLKALGVDEAAYSAIVVPEVIAKLPDAFRFTITRGHDFAEWSMKDALNAILKELEHREAHKPIGERSKGNDGEKLRERSRHYRQIGSASALHAKHEGRNEGSTNDKAARNCVYCLGEHRPEEYKKVINVNERKQLIHGLGFLACCFNIERAKNIEWLRIFLTNKSSCTILIQDEHKIKM